MQVEVYADGGARGNPGPAAAGVLLREEADEIRLAIYLGDRLTNNQAEYLAVIAALRYIHRNFPVEETKRVAFYLDSELIVRQLNGAYKVKNQGLKGLYQQVRALMKPLRMVEYRYVSREENREADGLVNLVLDLRKVLSVRG